MLRDGPVRLVQLVMLVLLARKESLETWVQLETTGQAVLREIKEKLVIQVRLDQLVQLDQAAQMVHREIKVTKVRPARKASRVAQVLMDLLAQLVSREQVDQQGDPDRRVSLDSLDLQVHVGQLVTKVK